MSSMVELRARIDELNKELLSVIRARGEVVMEIAEYKRTHDLDAYDPDREDQMLDALEQLPSAPFESEAVRAIFQEVLRASRELQIRRNQANPSQEKAAS